MYYAGMGISQKRLLIILRILVTAAAWIAIVVNAHSLAHAYEEELATVLTSPYAKLTAVVIFLTCGWPIRNYHLPCRCILVQRNNSH